MRIAGSVVLGVAAVLLGLFGALVLGASGLTLAGPGLAVIPYSDSDDSERSIGIAMGIVAVVGWLALLLASALVGLTGAERAPRGRRVAVALVVGVSGLVVMGVLLVVLGTAPPASEYPLREWNRA